MSNLNNNFTSIQNLLSIFLMATKAYGVTSIDVRGKKKIGRVMA